MNGVAHTAQVGVAHREASEQESVPAKQVQHCVVCEAVAEHFNLKGSNHDLESRRTRP